MIEKPSKLQPALLGGLVLGFGSVIPIVSYGNLCCCGWGIVGGALAAYLLIKRSPVLPVTKSDGAGAGSLAGVVGSLIYLVIGVPFTLLQWKSLVAQMEQRSENFPDAASREMMNQIVAMMQGHPVLICLVMWIMFSVVAVGAAALGGVIGVAIFEKRRAQPYPPQPPISSAGFPPASYGIPDPPVSDTTPPEPPYGSGDTPQR
ncbi:MAG TPA: hypothetical protein VKN18_31085 [Blastocatellia bacterium]|nr:hypothetical protein [Blastocatellia bacterium]